MRGRFSLTTSPLRKAPSIYKRSAKAKPKKTLKNSPYQPQPIPEYKTERLFEEKLTPKKKATKTETPKNNTVRTPKNNNASQTPKNNNISQTPKNNTTAQTPRNNSTAQTPKNNISQTPTLKQRSPPRSPPNFEVEETFFILPKEDLDIDELKAQYEELVEQYNNELVLREELKNDCETLDQNLQQAYKQQSKLSRQLKNSNQM